MRSPDKQISVPAVMAAYRMAVVLGGSHDDTGRDGGIAQLYDLPVQFGILVEIEDAVGEVA